MKPKYAIVLSELTLQQIVVYKNDLSKKKINVKPGGYFQKQLDISREHGLNLKSMSCEKFIELLLATKRPIIFAESAIKCDGTDWNRTELKILGDINVAMPVKIYDNGVWSPHDEHFKQHKPPIKGHLLFTPGALLEKGGIFHGKTPDYEEIVVGGNINTEKYNHFIERRLCPLFAYANESAKKVGKKAFITIPGIGCGAFSGKFKGTVQTYLNKALQYILEKHGKNYSNISCVYFDPYNNCKNQDKIIGGIKYRIRSALKNPGKSQLCKPSAYQDIGDDFTSCTLYKFVAWDHVSLPGNDYFAGCRATDDGVTAAATNSMEIITGLKGHYDNGGYYMPPEGYKYWKKVANNNNVHLEINGNATIVTMDDDCIELNEFEKMFEI